MKRSFPISEDLNEHHKSKVSLVEGDNYQCRFPLFNTANGNNHLVDLAMEIQMADNFVQSTTSSKLQTVIEQIRFLQHQAQIILEEAKKNLNLHHAACNFVKVPGNVYHLYKKLTGQNYFSMLSPQEWHNHPHDFLGSFRLEKDHSWTPLDKIQEREFQLSLVNKLFTCDDQLILQEKLCN